MKKIIATCNTYYQLLVLIQLKKTTFKNDYMSLIITNRTSGLINVYEKIKKNDIFDDCFFIDYDKFISENKFVKWSKIPLFSFGIKDRIIDRIDLRFDMILFYNLDWLSFYLYSLIKKLNSDVSVSRFEEGVLSYDMLEHEGEFKTQKYDIRFALLLQKIRFKNNICEKIDGFYCFFPNLYNGDKLAIQIPFINYLDIEKDIDKIFMLPPIHIKEKYIYFSSVYDFEGGHRIGEDELIDSIVKKFGEDNVIIKVHPRDDRGIFEDKYNTLDSIKDIPWEVFQIRADLSDKVLLAATSGSLINICESNDSAKVYYLFKMCDCNDNSLAYNSIRSIIKTVNLLKYKNIKIIDDLNDIE